MNEISLATCKSCEYHALCKGHYDYYQNGVHVTDIFTLDECKEMKRVLEKI